MPTSAEAMAGTKVPQHRDRGRVGEIFLVAGAAALVSAAWYAGSFGARFWLAGQIVNVSQDLAWMAPVSSLAFFFAAATPVGILALFLRLALARRLAFGIFAGLAVLAILLPYSQISEVASLLMAGGVGTAVARLAETRAPECLRWARRMTLALGGLFALVASSIGLRSHLATSRALGALPPADSSAPNVLLIVLDAVRASALSSYGYRHATTPFLDSLAGEGVLFEHAFAVAPWTLPSHESMFTGDYQFVGGRSSSFLKRPTEDGKAVLATLFASRGYETAGFVANFHYAGWDSELDRGFAQYQDYPRSVEQVLRSSSFGQTMTARRIYSDPTMSGIARALTRPDLYMNPRPANAVKHAAALTNEFLGWLAEREARPFFVFMNYYDTHEPYEPPPPFASLFPSGAHDRHLYDGALASVDQELKRLVAGLVRRGALDNTLLIITADHGELFGEHGLTGHHSSLYLDVLHVPLIVRFPPGVPANTRVASAVSLRDLAATILDLTHHPARASVPGTTLAARWRDTTAVGSPIFAAVEQGVRVDSTLPFARGDMVSMLDNQWHYIRNNGTGREELYRYREDPAELTDYVGVAAADSIVARFRRSIQALIAAGAASPPGR